MAKELRSIQVSFNGIDRAAIEQAMIAKVVARPDILISSKSLKIAQKQRDRLTSTLESSTILPVDFLGEKMRNVCGLPKAETEPWTTTLHRLLQIYQRSIMLSSQRTAHSSAYEASFSMLYGGELEAARQGPRPPKHPETFALRVAKTKVGMAPPRADTRFQVEAIWMSIDIRGMISGLAEKWFSTLLEKAGASSGQLTGWIDFITFIHDSCSHDAQCAAKIAGTSSAHRQELLSGLRVFRASWRRMQFEVIAQQASPGGLDSEGRRLLAESTEQRLLLIKEAARDFKHRYISNGRMLSTVVRDEFDVPLEQVFNNWEELIATLNRPTVFYQSVSDDERRQVIGSFKLEFSE